ncbi:hypothetical protein TNCV_1266311 [Trichonephila clavipes]|nr:hypothetical protein TNCV_1266311 [Trichonephila clavipes]
MVHQHTGRSKCEITSMNIFLTGGLDKSRTWPARSPDLTLCDFFQWRYLKDKIFILTLPVDLAETAHPQPLSKDLDSDTLTRFWAEIDCRLNVCRETKDSHIEPSVTVYNKTLNNPIQFCYR